MSAFEKFCPFIKDTCREDCTFRCRNVTTSQGITTCLIASKLDCINEMMSDQLTSIEQAIESK